MFYSHEILTSRKYGVATVWLVATLGAKSNAAKKLTRKAILDVDVRKACKTIIGPEAPMALRLQSNLMFGVTRVYSQQCGYVLADALSAQTHLRTLFKNTNNDELDPEAGKTRPDQLILLDDPAFMPDMDLPALDFDFSNLGLDMGILGDSQKSSLLSPHSQQHRGSAASHDGSVIGLNIPPSSSRISYQLPYNDPFQLGASSAQKIPGANRLFGDEEEKLLDDFDFVFDANGEIRDINPEERELLCSGTIAPELLGRLEGDSAASGRVRREHQEALAGRSCGRTLDPDGDYIMHFDDGFNILPEAEPFPAMTAEARRARFNANSSAIGQEESSSVTIEAKFQARKRKATKALIVDHSISLRNADLRDWQNSYVENMLAANHKKQVHRVTGIAKKNAYSWVFGSGLGGVGNGVGGSNLRSPLGMFAGDSLQSLIVSTPATTAAHSPKRAREEVDVDLLDRNVRPRISQDLDQIGRGDDGFLSQFDDSTGLEIGREVRTALEDRPASAMPWNISSSLHSYRNLPGWSSVQGPGTATGRPSSVRPGSRLTSASPLLGRGRTSAEGNIPDFGRLDDLDDIPVLPGYSDIHLGRGRTLSLSHTVVEEFEVFGPSAAVDTQTAQNTQWVRDALARESMNFLEFVRNTLAEGEADELADDVDIVGEAKEVGFEALFPPESNSMMVAAQAFHHVLTLATRNLLGVRQEEPFDEIYLRVETLI